MFIRNNKVFCMALYCVVLYCIVLCCIELPYSMDVSFRLAKDYPVDLYYIMDLSNTMIKSLGSVANLGNQLGNNSM